MRITIDTNVLVYTIAQDPDRTPVARTIVESVVYLDLLLTTQVLGEFIKIIRQKHRESLSEVLSVVDGWSLVFPIAGTTPEHLMAAARLAERHHLQFWDSVILTVAADAGVEVILTEDLQDGAAIGGVRVLDPFLPGNADALATLLTPAPGTG